MLPFCLEDKRQRCCSRCRCLSSITIIIIIFIIMPLAPLPLVLVLVLVSSSSSSTLRTFVVRDPGAGRRPVTCDRCPPGTYLRSACTAERRSVCAACPSDSFTELWNHIGQCLRCRVCARNQVLRSACTASSDTVCECTEGFYFRAEYDMCVRHSACPPGYGVLSPGSPVSDTVCRRCSNQTFSDVPSAQNGCSRHSSCSDRGMLQVLSGSRWHDSVCASCRERKDAVLYLSHILPSFFHQLNHRTLQSIRLRFQPEDDSAPLRAEPHRWMWSWTRNTSSRRVIDLLLLLNECGATDAQKLKRKTRRIKHTLDKECGPEEGL